MEISLWLMFFHFLGFGLLMTMLVTGWLLHRQYMSLKDFKSKAVVLSSARAIGLLSPVAILVMLVTGFGNMHERALGLLTETWLSVKILLFVIAAVNGVIFGIRSKKRGMLVGQMAQGSTSPDNESKLASMDRSAFAFYIIQTILLTTILILSVWKPGRGM